MLTFGKGIHILFTEILSKQLLIWRCTVFDFDQPVNRNGTGNMKGSFQPETACGKAPLIFAGAEMDFPTAPVIREALSRFAENGIYGFTLPDETYLNAVCFWLKAYRGWDVSPDWIVPM